MKRLFLLLVSASLLVPVGSQAQLLESRLSLTSIPSLTLTAGSGQKALQLQTGAFLDLGGGSNDYLYSDGSYIYTPTLFGASTFFATVTTPGFVSLYGANGTKFCPGADTACFTSDGTTISAPALSLTAASGTMARAIASGAKDCFDGTTCSYYLYKNGYYLTAAGFSGITTGGTLIADGEIGTAARFLGRVSTIVLRGTATDGATAVGARSENTNTLSTAGAQIHCFRKGTSGADQACIDKDGTYSMDGTDASGTPGAATINQPIGQVAVAAAASSVVVTNSLVTTASVVVPVLQAIDATCTSILSVVPAAGSFTVTMNAVCTGNTKVGFLLHNYF
jgi:hypothetical protein